MSADREAVGKIVDTYAEENGLWSASVDYPTVDLDADFDAERILFEALSKAKESFSSYIEDELGYDASFWELGTIHGWTLTQDWERDIRIEIKEEKPDGEPDE